MQLYFKPTIVCSVEEHIKSKGYIPLKKIAKTLQGGIWRVKKGDKNYIIKIAKKSLHKKSITINTSGKKIKIAENILNETSILHYLTSNNPPSSLVKYEDFFYDKYNYYLVMEDGGKCLFDFVVKCHELIKKNLMSIQEWHKFCKNAIKQIINLLDWLHDSMNCCHLDLSLDNFVISNALIFGHGEGKMRITEQFEIKLIDFGLAEIFTSTQCDSNEISFCCKKYCGKTLYFAPEIFHKKSVFNAKKADVWSFGVCFFMMIVGLSPYHMPIIYDPCFKQIINGQFITLLKKSKRIEYVDDVILDLMRKIFTAEEYRINIKEIAKHPYFLYNF